MQSELSSDSKAGLRNWRLMNRSKKQQSPTPAAIRDARAAADLTQTEAAQTVRASLRGWQQWEAGDRAMPPGLFELFMLKTGQWPLEKDQGAESATRTGI